jgi:hypothetical protein
MWLWNRIARPSGSSGYAFGCLEANAGSAGALAELDQPACLGFREQRVGFFTKPLDRPVADSGDEEVGENDASEIFDLFDDLPFLTDLRLKRRRREVDARDAAVAALCSPAPATGIGCYEFTFAAPPFGDEFRFVF